MPSPWHTAITELEMQYALLPPSSSGATVAGSTKGSAQAFNGSCFHFSIITARKALKKKNGSFFATTSFHILMHLWNATLHSIPVFCSTTTPCLCF